MQRSTTKQATISIHWKGEDPGVEYQRNITKDNWGDLASEILSAQQYILDNTGEEVARDVVMVKLQGPDFVNLTIVDLPGIVRTSGTGESQSLARDTQLLVNEYMRNPRCVILAVHPANVDFHNSSVMADAQQVDPGTKRTLCMLWAKRRRFLTVSSLGKA
eukprot:scaffold657_cov214-Amphora_coffeaeformis.AAC.2